MSLSSKIWFFVTQSFTSPLFCGNNKVQHILVEPNQKKNKTNEELHHCYFFTLLIYGRVDNVLVKIAPELSQPLYQFIKAVGVW